MASDPTRNDITRWELAARLFRLSPIIVLPPSASQSSQPTLTDRYANLENEPLSALKTSYFSKFQCHDCIAYNIAVGFYENDDLFDALWAKSYPRRDMRWVNGNHGWLVRELKVRKSGGEAGALAQSEFGEGKITLEAIKDLHEQILALLNKIESITFETSLNSVFLVFDKADWEGKGCAVFCRDQDVVKHGLAKTEKVESVGDWGVWRVKIEEAVEIIITDEERKKAQAPLKDDVKERKISGGLGFCCSP